MSRYLAPMKTKGVLLPKFAGVGTFDIKDMPWSGFEPGFLMCFYAGPTSTACLPRPKRESLREVIRSPTILEACCKLAEMCQNLTEFLFTTRVHPAPAPSHKGSKQIGEAAC